MLEEESVEGRQLFGITNKYVSPFVKRATSDIDKVDPDEAMALLHCCYPEYSLLSGSVIGFGARALDDVEINCVENVQEQLDAEFRYVTEAGYAYVSRTNKLIRNGKEIQAAGVENAAETLNKLSNILIAVKAHEDAHKAGVGKPLQAFIEW